MLELEAQQPDLAERHSAAVAAEVAEVERRFGETAPFKPTCGCSQPALELSDVPLRAMYVGSTFLAYVRVPRHVCSKCQVPAYPHPYAAGCVAASPVRPTTLLSLAVVQGFIHEHLLDGKSADGAFGKLA